MKINNNFTVESFSSKESLEEYRNAVDFIGLWNSERIMCEKHFNKEESILDIGCGAGRTTFGLYNLGFRAIEGLDITPGMIEFAKSFSEEKKMDISFVVGDATTLQYEDESFDGVLFSFNGLMCIPGRDIRQKVFEEVHRVLKKESCFIFTAHDFNEGLKDYKEHWDEEKKRWDNSEQDDRYHEFGDLIVTDGKGHRDLFVHIAQHGEIERAIKNAGFKLVETKLRSEIADESEATKKFALETRFWIVRK